MILSLWCYPCFLYSTTTFMAKVCFFDINHAKYSTNISAVKAFQSRLSDPRMVVVNDQCRENIYLHQLYKQLYFNYCNNNIISASYLNEVTAIILFAAVSSGGHCTSTCYVIAYHCHICNVRWVPVNHSIENDQQGNSAVRHAPFFNYLHAIDWPCRIRAEQPVQLTGRKPASWTCIYNATCVATETSKVPTRVALLLIFYSVLSVLWTKLWTNSLTPLFLTSCPRSRNVCSSLATITRVLSMRTITMLVARNSPFCNKSGFVMFLAKYIVKNDPNYWLFCRKRCSKQRQRSSLVAGGSMSGISAWKMHTSGDRMSICTSRRKRTGWKWRQGYSLFWFNEGISLRP